eukprot:GEZU01012882.1.p2 GENE.GEZU01012882.1~~GEZU01012882.1.p2  ORF type:complete len:120 (-),score=46.36 GEZU01012882.1:223-582(-)
MFRNRALIKSIKKDSKPIIAYQFNRYVNTSDNRTWNKETASNMADRAKANMGGQKSNTNNTGMILLATSLLGATAYYFWHKSQFAKSDEDYARDKLGHTYDMAKEGKYVDIRKGDKKQQ